MRTVTVTDIDGDGCFALGEAKVSDDGADNDVLAALVVEEVYQRLTGMEKYIHWQTQPRLLYAIRRIVIAQEGGQKNGEREERVFRAFIAAYGLDGLGKMLGIGVKK
jgi:hypothetical protein